MPMPTPTSGPPALTLTATPSSWAQPAVNRSAAPASRTEPYRMAEDLMVAQRERADPRFRCFKYGRFAVRCGRDQMLRNIREACDGTVGGLHRRWGDRGQRPGALGTVLYRSAGHDADDDVQDRHHGRDRPEPRRTQRGGA